MAKNLTEAPIFTVPDNDEELIDLVATLNDQAKDIEAHLKFLKEAAKGRLSIGDHQGRHYSCVVAARSRTGLDSERVKAEMGEDWWAERQKVTEYVEMRFKPLQDGQVSIG